MKPIHPSYDAYRPYRHRIVEIHRNLGLTTFTEQAQFWSLGGPEHHEYVELQKHLDFWPRSYHTVDRGYMLPVGRDDKIIQHQFTEFETIYKLWSNPLTISYDSTEVITRRGSRNSHDRKIFNLIDLVRMALAATIHPHVVVHANYMLAYPGTYNLKKNGLFFKEDYIKWLSILCEHFNDIEVFDSQIERMTGSATDMIDFHFIVRK